MTEGSKLALHIRVNFQLIQISIDPDTLFLVTGLLRLVNLFYANKLAVACLHNRHFLCDVTYSESQKPVRATSHPSLRLGVTVTVTTGLVYICLNEWEIWSV